MGEHITMGKKKSTWKRKPASRAAAAAARSGTLNKLLVTQIAICYTFLLRPARQHCQIYLSADTWRHSQEIIASTLSLFSRSSRLVTRRVLIFKPLGDDFMTHGHQASIKRLPFGMVVHAGFFLGEANQ